MKLPDEIKAWRQAERARLIAEQMARAACLLTATATRSAWPPIDRGSAAAQRARAAGVPRAA